MPNYDIVNAKEEPTNISKLLFKANDNKEEIIEEQNVQLESQNQKALWDTLKEILAAIKDDRMNTKRTIAELAEGDKKVLEQNNAVIDSCRKVLENDNLTDEDRMRLIDIMQQRAESSEKSHNDSKEDIKNELNHSHDLPKRIGAAAAVGVVIVLGAKLCKRFIA